MNRTSANPRRLILFPLIVLAALVSACDQAEPTAATVQNGPKEIPVSVMEIRPTSIRDVLLLPGETEPHLDVRVSSDAGGQVEELLFQEGDHVQKGDLLAKIDVAARKAALDRAQAAFDLAEKLYERRRSLFERSIITQEELDYSRTERIRAQADLDQARVEYRDGFPRAPIGGVVNALHVDQGEFINRGDPLMDVVDIQQIEINVNVPELDVRFLQESQRVPVTIDALEGKRYDGRIDFIAYKADPATKTFRVKVLMDNPAGDVRPGMIARVAFLRRVIPDALTVPLFALVDKGGERLVFVVEDGIARAREVSLGIIEGPLVQVSQGIEEGELLIVKGHRDVEEGTRVTVR